MKKKGNCLQCGKKLKGQQTKFCCRACQERYYRKQRLAARKTYTRNCGYCGKEFKTFSVVQKYCGPDCAKKIIYQHAGERAKQKKDGTAESFEPGHKPKISLNEAAKMAAAQGKTYGEMFQREVKIVFPWSGG